MTPPQFRVLTSLIVVLLLFILALLAGSYVLNALTGDAAPPPATPTPVPAVEQPLPIASPTGVAKAAATGVPASAITPTPGASGKVFMTAGDTPDGPHVTTFKAGSVDPYCWVHSKDLSSKSAATFSWRDAASNSFLWQFPEARQSGPYTGSYYKYVSTHPGRYSCDVTVNGQPFGSAPFTVTS